MTANGGPLAGFRVLELGSTVAGPFGGRLLADFGAEVIKVEPPEGDPVRAMGKHVDGKSLYAATILRNKQLIALDLRQPGARPSTSARRGARHRHGDRPLRSAKEALKNSPRNVLGA